MPIKSSLKFGDIFNIKGEQYVYLTVINQIWYAGLILDQERTRECNRLFSKKIRRNEPTDISALCYVILTTDEFRDRAAYLNQPSQSRSGWLPDPLSVSLNSSDCQMIIKEVLRNRRIFPKELVKFIETLKNNETKK